MHFVKRLTRKKQKCSYDNGLFLEGNNGYCEYLKHCYNY